MKKNSQGHYDTQNVQKSPFHDIKTEQYSHFGEKRKQDEVSSQWLRITAAQFIV
jgi:hypothetical protein